MQTTPTLVGVVLLAIRQRRITSSYYLEITVPVMPSDGKPETPKPFVQSLSVVANAEVVAIGDQIKLLVEIPITVPIFVANDG